MTFEVLRGPSIWDRVGISLLPPVGDANIDPAVGQKRVGPRPP